MIFKADSALIFPPLIYQTAYSALFSKDSEHMFLKFKRYQIFVLR